MEPPLAKLEGARYRTYTIREESMLENQERMLKIGVISAENLNREISKWIFPSKNKSLNKLGES